ncbi:TPA: type I restriction endonuclease subunit R, partial [Klebsiella michiganensis]
RVIYEKITSITGPEYDLQAKDTESYYSILFQGKTNRWLIRYYDKKNRSSIQLPIDISEITGNEIKRAGLEFDNNRIFIDNPEDVLRISGLILDSLQYVQNDENFRKRRS